MKSSRPIGLGGQLFMVKYHLDQELYPISAPCAPEIFRDVASALL